jgi:predicted PurR-regulated permease PerM
MLAEQLPPAEEFYNSLTTQEGVGALESIFGVASGIFSGMGTLIFSIILSLYWSVDQFRFERLGLSLLPRDWHPRALSAWRAVETGVGRFIRSEVVKSVFALVVLGAGFIALDLKYPVLLAMWVAIARLVPWFGVIIALAPTILIWMGISPAVGFIYAIFTLSVLIMIYRIIQPRIFVMPEYNSLPVLLLAVALGQAFGLLGVVLAPLLGLALRLLIQELSPAPRGRLSPDVLRKNTQLLVRLSGLRTALEHSSGAEVTYLVTRLQSLARKTRDYLRGY